MQQLDYDAIKPLVAQSAQEGDQLVCTFRCPVSGESVQARAALKHGGLGGEFADRAQKRAVRGLKWRLASAVRGALGGGILGGAAGDVARSMLGNVGDQGSYSDEEKQQATVAAFESVRSHFVWTGGRRGWIAVQAAGDVLTDFAGQLSRAPVSQPYDRTVLTRMLVEIAAADGELAQEEREFLNSFVDPESGSVEQISNGPKLSSAELGECSAGAVRETMLMLAWGVALTDEEVAAAEQSRLGQFAVGLQISEPRANELKVHAQMHLVDQALEPAYSAGQRDEGKRAAALQFAQRIGLPDEQAERVDIRLRKRLGLR